MSRESTVAVLAEVGIERARQQAKHGDQTDLPDGTGPLLKIDVGWTHPTAEYLAKRMTDRTNAASRNEGDGTVTFEQILTEEWAEAIAESDPARLRAELVQVAAVAVQWIEAIDGRPTS